MQSLFNTSLKYRKDVLKQSLFQTVFGAENISFGSVSKEP
jgi:hypothetical protein